MSVRSLSEMDSFPSPCGVNIVGNSLVMAMWQGTGITTFPSPCGVNIVGNPSYFGDYLVIFAVSVSVPLRGKYCREYSYAILLAGSIYLFPSPCGVNIVGNKKVLLI